MSKNAPTLLLGESDLLSLLSFEAAYAASEDAFRLVGEGKMTVTHNAPLFPDGEGANLFGSMAVLWQEQHLAGFKWFNMFSRQQPGFPSMNGHVIVLSSTENGAPTAILAGTPITNYRTAAGHGVLAAKTLARRDSSVFALIGCGSQGELGLHAVLRQLPIRRVILWNHRQEKAAALAGRTAAQHPELEIVLAESPSAAAAAADIIMTATTSREPLLTGADIPAGATVIGLYSFNDIAKDAASAADLWLLGSRAADERSILQSRKLLERNAVPDSALVSGDLCDVLCRRHPGRTSDSQRILYTHMGMAALDIVLALRMTEAAREAGLGQELCF